MGLEVEQFAQETLALLGAFPMSIIIVVIVSAARRFVALAGKAGFGLKDGRSRRCSVCGNCPDRAFDDLVQLSTVKPNPPTFWAIVYFNSAPISHHQRFIVYWAAHIHLHFAFLNRWGPFSCAQEACDAIVAGGPTY